MSTRFITLAGGMGVRRMDEQDQPLVREKFDPPPNHLRVRTVLVVGGAGYIGSTLVRGLLFDGYRVRVLDSLEFGDSSIRALYQNPDFEIIRGDSRCVEPVVRATRGVDAVVHLGGIVGEPACALDEDRTLETNLAATSLLAEVCRGAAVSRLLFASSCSVYGAAGQIADEDSPPNPVSLYAATKADSEKVLLAARNSALHPVIFRLATAFGWSYRPRFDLLVNLLTARAMYERRITVYNGEQWRPFVHVEDICRAFRMALVAPLEMVSGQVFNAGSSYMNFTLRQLADTIASMEPATDIEYRENSELRDHRVSFEKIRRTLGFQCHVSLHAGVRGVQKALRQGQVKDYRDPLYSNYQAMLAQMRRPHERPAPQDDLMAPRFSKNSLWWHINGSNVVQPPVSRGPAAEGASNPAVFRLAAGG